MSVIARPARSRWRSRATRRPDASGATRPELYSAFLNLLWKRGPPTTPAKRDPFATEAEGTATYIGYLMKRCCADRMYLADYQEDLGGLLIGKSCDLGDGQLAGFGELAAKSNPTSFGGC